MSKETYKTKFRRRIQKKTNYRKRLAFAKSKTEKAVFRRTNTRIIGQIIRFEPKGDITIAQADSREFKKIDKRLGSKNMPSAYLTGLLLGKRALDKGIKKANLDIGFYTPVHKGKWCAFLKGLLDAGMEIKHDNKILPIKERIDGKHISEDLVKKVEEIKNKILAGNLEKVSK